MSIFIDFVRKKALYNDLLQLLKCEFIPIYIIPLHVFFVHWFYTDIWYHIYIDREKERPPVPLRHSAYILFYVSIYALVCFLSFDLVCNSHSSLMIFFMLDLVL